MKKRKVSVKVVVLSVMWSVLLLGLGFVYMDARKTMITSLNVALEDAILKDYQERHDDELKYSSGRLGRKVKGITIVTEKEKRTSSLRIALMKLWQIDWQHSICWHKSIRFIPTL